MTWPKNGPIWSNISGSTGPIFTIFTPYERALRGDDESVAFFPIYQGMLPWQPNNIAKVYQRWLIPPALGALELENELQYHGLAVGNISAYDVRISCKNFVKFGTVTPQLTGIIFERQVWRGKKTGIFRQISLELLYRFSQSLHHMKALYVRMTDL